jgi:two-component system cell cycle sensor histidine kinase PleC
MAPTAPPREEITPSSRDAYRRRIAHGLRHARDQLNVAAGLSRPVDYELTRSFVKGYLRAWPLHLLLLLLLSFAAMIWVPASAVAPPFLILAAAALAMCAASHRFLQLEPSGIPLETWRWGLALGELLQGIAWILFVLPFFSESLAEVQRPYGHSFVLVTVLLVMVSTAILRASIPMAVVAGMVPLSVIVIVAGALATGPEETMLTLLALGGQILSFWLAHRLHRIAEATFRSNAEMRASFAELEQARANSSEARRRAEEADRAKAQFLATVSHELRTPLNAILGFSEVMKNEVLGSHSTPSYREYSNDIHGSGQHLLSLINEILDLSRIEAGQYELNEEPVVLGDIIAETVDSMATWAEAKSQTVMQLIDPTIGPVWAGRRAVRQMIGNLLSNAIKFTAPGGRIVIKVGWTSLGGHYVSIRDDGPGIPPDEIPVVLSSFGRGSLAVTTAEPGAGLGLSIVKGLAELHGGRFVLNSKPREGTEAAITFPPSRVGAAEPQPRARSVADAPVQASDNRSDTPAWPKVAMSR